MAKLSLINREAKRKALVDKFSEKRKMRFNNTSVKVKMVSVIPEVKKAVKAAPEKIETPEKKK